MPESCQIAIIGGGVVGAALARELAGRFSDIVLLEKESVLAYHTSGRNSGVIHSGINPKPGTLKARLCVEGSRLLRSWCRERGVPFAETGTLVTVQSQAEVPVLQELVERAGNNGVPDVRLLSAAQAQQVEPAVRCAAALHSPTGALVDSVRLTESLADDARRQGVQIRLSTEACRIRESDDGAILDLREGSLHARYVINCAGLHADRLAHQMGVGRDYGLLPFRGEYFVIRGKSAERVRSMIYPVPDLRFPFLGIHLTRTLTGDVLVGPNAVPAFGREVYRWKDLRSADFLETVGHPFFWKALWHNRRLRTVAWNELRHSCSRSHFVRSAQRLLNGLDPDDITLDSRVGIRAQLVRRDGELVDDLIIEKTPHTMHLLNVVSPGMTTAMAFAAWLQNEHRLPL